MTDEQMVIILALSWWAIFPAALLLSTLTIRALRPK